MTNLEAYEARNSDTSGGNLTLAQYSVNPLSDDKNVISGALGMLDRAISADYKQGDTSESMSNFARQMLYDRAVSILKENGIEVITSTQIEIIGSGW